MIEERYPSKLLEEAVEAIKTLPSVGSKTALRLALHLLKLPRSRSSYLIETVSKLCEKVQYCRSCSMISDSEYCEICTDKTRDRRQICVVANVQDVMCIENTGQYRGLYHVLGGIISPINSVSPSDLSIDLLYSRIESLLTEYAAIDIEVILALSGEADGEITAFYIYSAIKKYGIKVSTLARGLDFGADLEYANEQSLARSILDRKPFTST